MKRTTLLLAGLLTMACSDASHGRFPARAIELIIAFPPGGVTDLAGRVFAEGLSSTLKVPVVSTNRGGSSGVLGGSIVLQARKDGYTLLTNSLSGMVLGPAVMKQAPFDAERDFVPIALILTVPDSLIVRADSPFKTVADLIEAAKKHPGKLSYASPGTTSDGHFNGEVFARAANIKIKHVPFNGGSELAIAVMGGHVDFGIGAATSFVALDRGGKLRTLAVTGRVRLNALPHAPTFEESGITGTFVDAWAGCFAPSGTPPPVLDTLVNAAAIVVQSSDFKSKIEKIGGIPRYLTPQEILAMIRTDTGTAVSIGTRMGLSLER